MLPPTFMFSPHGSPITRAADEWSHLWTRSARLRERERESGASCQDVFKAARGRLAKYSARPNKCGKWRVNLQDGAM